MTYLCKALTKIIICVSECSGLVVELPPSTTGTNVGDRPSGLVKWEEDRTSTPTDAESDTEFGTSEGTGMSGVDGGKDGK